MVPVLDRWYIHVIGLKCKSNKNIAILVGFVGSVKIPIFKIIQVGIPDKIIIDDHGNPYILGDPDPKYEEAFPNARETFFHSGRWKLLE